MDTLTFNSPILLRHLTFSEAKKTPISEIRLDVALRELDMNMDQVRRVGMPHSATARAEPSSLSCVSCSAAITWSRARASGQRRH